MEERTLRGGDEVVFVANADAIADSPLGASQWTDALTSSLHELVLAAQVALLDSPDLVLRITQIAIAMAGLVLLAVAVHELAGARASSIAMWLLALEPAGVFFSSILHKEPILFLAGGLVAFGGAMLWKRGEARWLGPVALGCLIAVTTRPYVGWFLIAAGAAIALHAGLRRDRESAAGAILACVLSFGLVETAPAVLRKRAPAGSAASRLDAHNLGGR